MSREMKFTCLIAGLTALLISCTSPLPNKIKGSKPYSKDCKLVVLGNVQDGGSPHMGCHKKCCKGLFENGNSNRYVVSLGAVDPLADKQYIFEASPDFSQQCQMLLSHAKDSSKKIPDGVFLTHAHIGHYTGLMFLGKEALNRSEAAVYTMPKMHDFLTNNGPWSQLVSNKNIVLNALSAQKELKLTPSLSVTPLVVPHRDEFSETVGYIISGPKRKALFIPDIDNWEKWDQDIVEWIKEVDYAFIDATFYDAAEVNHRNIAEIPHPFVIESMEKFKNLTRKEKARVHFIHFNHTNPLLKHNSRESVHVQHEGFNIARQGMEFKL